MLKLIQPIEGFIQFLADYGGYENYDEEQAQDRKPLLSYTDYQNMTEQDQKIINVAYYKTLLKQPIQKPTNSFTLQSFFSHESRQNL